MSYPLTAEIPSTSCTSAPLLHRHFSFAVCFRAYTLTREYSIRAPETNNMPADIHTSMALMYETLGRRWLTPELCVVIVNTVSNPVKVENDTKLP